MTYTAVVSTAVSTVSRAALCALLGLCLMAGLLPRAGASTAPPTFTVTRTADDTAPGSLRSAIALAAAVGGTVVFQIPATDPGVSSGTATITLALGPLVVPSSLSIVGPNTPSGAVIVSGGTGMNQSRVFSVTGGTVMFSNITITNGSALFSLVVGMQGGGGILNNANLTLNNCMVIGNTASQGGGGINNSGSGASLTLTNCTVSGNTIQFEGNGGGIANSGTLLLTGCTLTSNSAGSNNSAPSGGGLFNSGTATLNACTLTGNGAGGFFGGGGGGAYNSGSSASLTLNNSQVTGNGTVAFGGGINNSGGTLTLSACTISNNGAGRGFNNRGTGGGIYNVGTAQITNCLVVHNSSFSVAGMVNFGTLTLINSTFTGNTVFPAMVDQIGLTPTGGLYSGPATLVNDILYFDTVTNFGISTPSEIVAVSGTTGPTVTYSDVDQTTGVYPGAGNINADPQFVRNADTSTFPGDPGDEHLKLTSPAVHTGTNGPGVPLTDIEGTPRPTPPARPSMGAYEVPGSTGGFSAQGGFVVTGTQNVSTGSQVVAKFLPGTTPAASFTATVDFGDGSGPMLATISPDPTTSGVFQVTASHTYTDFGTFPITVTISGPGGTPNATVTSTATIQPAQVATDVTSQVTVLRGGFYRNRFTGRYSQTVTIKNNTSAAITGPISLALDNLTSGAAAINAAGTTQFATPAGSPYFTVQTGNLAPGATASLFLQFTYIGGSQIDYTPRVLAGPGAR